MAQENIGFDRYQRFRAVADLIDDLAGGQSLSILDVGPFDQAFQDFVPQHRLTPHAGLVRPPDQGLPYADASFQVVTALDVLEHVAPGERPFFLAELSRVAADSLVLASPVAQAAAAEDLVWRLTQSPWLAQHREHGLPEPEQVEAMLTGLGLVWRRHANACLPSWTAMMLLMYGVQDQATRQEISAFFNRHYYTLENREPAYRYIYVCRRASRGPA